MGVDFDAVGGIGIYVDDYIDKIIDKGVLNKEKYDKTPGNCLEGFGIRYDSFGDHLSDEQAYAWLVEGETLSEILENVPEFINVFKQYDISLTYDDLKVISELRVW